MHRRITVWSWIEGAVDVKMAGSGATMGLAFATSICVANRAETGR